MSAAKVSILKCVGWLVFVVVFWWWMFRFSLIVLSITTHTHAIRAVVATHSIGDRVILFCWFTLLTKTVSV